MIRKTATVVWRSSAVVVSLSIGELYTPLQPQLPHFDTYRCVRNGLHSTLTIFGNRLKINIQTYITILFGCYFFSQLINVYDKHLHTYKDDGDRRTPVVAQQ